MQNPNPDEQKFQPSHLCKQITKYSNHLNHIIDSNKKISSPSMKFDFLMQKTNIRGKKANVITLVPSACKAKETPL
jgi:hypothetical protein